MNFFYLLNCKEIYMPECIVKLQFMWIDYCLCIWDWAVVAASQTEYSRCLSSCDFSKPSGTYKVSSKAWVYSYSDRPRKPVQHPHYSWCCTKPLVFSVTPEQDPELLKIPCFGHNLPPTGREQATIFPEQTNGCCTPQCMLKVTELCHLQKVDTEFWGSQPGHSPYPNMPGDPVHEYHKQDWSLEAILA